MFDTKRARKTFLNILRARTWSKEVKEAQREVVELKWWNGEDYNSGLYF